MQPMTTSGGPNLVVPDDWGLLVDKAGKPHACLHNVATLIRRAHPWGGRVSVDDFSGRLLLDGEELQEGQEVEVTLWLQRSWSWKVARPLTAEALRAVGLQQRKDRLMAHVLACKWDGVPRVDTLASAYLGAKDTPHHRAASRVLLLSMAARALKPGCKVDTMVILEGPQGARKSTACRLLGGPFFAELNATLGTKEASEQVEGCWVAEVGELDALNRAELTAAKQFMSRQSDRYRRPYDSMVSDKPRRCVMIGTTNATVYLRDETGGRRWLPVSVGRVDAEGLERDRENLIAEAVARVVRGEPWWLADPEDEAGARAAVEERFEADPWEDRLRSWLVGRDAVTVLEVLTNVLGIEAGRQSHKDSSRVGKVLTHLGWTRHTRKSPKTGEQERYYRRGA